MDRGRHRSSQPVTSSQPQPQPQPPSPITPPSSMDSPTPPPPSPSPSTPRVPQALCFESFKTAGDDDLLHTKENDCGLGFSFKGRLREGGA
ncbi:hypothetical protein FNV43_RR10189 [Rhamnella rubrinervis]|uniref:Uncharacterized protein n=1 Tax=Rhamnella rubrinervis TaxID=2594499 RepID=A0A8K0HBB4_9ROSA|nr:hypothetical protein FNV43_RR10189 [Rhamnella rubrinervis]